jgi:carbamoyl-phosphate synthase large subunit
MRSTGECMGISDSFGSAFAKAQLAASNGLPLEGVVLITVVDSDKPTVTPIARRFHEMGFKILATGGTAQYLRSRGVPERQARHLLVLAFLNGTLDEVADPTLHDLLETRIAALAEQVLT